MTGWRVDPAGLNIIITDSSTAIQEVGMALDGAVATVGEVQAGAGYDGIVSTAYQGFMQELFDGAVTRMFTKYSTALEGTAGQPTPTWPETKRARARSHRASRASTSLRRRSRRRPPALRTVTRDEHLTARWSDRAVRAHHPREHPRR